MGQRSWLKRFELFSQRLRKILSGYIFFFNDTATTEIYTLSLHDALPICAARPFSCSASVGCPSPPGARVDRKSTRLNSSHSQISYAVFCLKKKTESHRSGRKHPLRYLPHS